MSFGSISTEWSAKAIEGSSFRLSDFRTCFLSDVTKLGIHGTLRSEADTFSFFFSPSAPFSFALPREMLPLAPVFVA